MKTFKVKYCKMVGSDDTKYDYETKTVKAEQLLDVPYVTVDHKTFSSTTDYCFIILEKGQPSEEAVTEVVTFPANEPVCSREDGHVWVTKSDVSVVSDMCPYCGAHRTNGYGYGQTESLRGTTYHLPMEKTGFYLSVRTSSERLALLREVFKGLGFIPSKSFKGSPSCVDTAKLQSMVDACR